MRIAICDDNEGDRTRIAEALAAYLAARGRSAEVTAFAHPDRLLEAARKEDFDIYLLDILMPMVDGIATVRELRGMKGKVPVVFFSTSRDYALEAYGVKAVDYVLKPWTEERFAEALDAALAVVPREADVYHSVKTLTGVRRFRPERITHVTTNAAMRNGVIIYLEDGERIELRGTIVGLREELFAKVPLVTVGKSLLVNPAFIVSVSGSSVTLARGQAFEVPKSALSTLRAAALAV